MAEERHGSGMGTACYVWIGLKGVMSQRHAPAALYPGKEPVPIVQEAEWAPGPVWTGAENLAPPGFDPRAVQPVANRYTDYTIRPTLLQCWGPNFRPIQNKWLNYLQRVAKTPGTTLIFIDYNKCSQLLLSILAHCLNLTESPALLSGTALYCHWYH